MNRYAEFVLRIKLEANRIEKRLNARFINFIKQVQIAIRPIVSTCARAKHVKAGRADGFWGIGTL